MYSDAEIFSAATAVSGFCMILSHYLLDFESTNKCNRSPRRWWSRPYLLWDRKYADKYLARLQEVDEKPFTEFMRMSPRDFNLLLKWVKPLIRKKEKNGRTISARTRLAATIRYVAGGESFQSLAKNMHISNQIISRFVPEVLSAIIKVLKDRQYIKVSL